MNTEKQRCPKELCIEKYYGREFNDKDKIVAEFGILCDLLESYEQQILANPSEFGLVKQEALSASERFRMEDGMSAINRENEILEQVKSLQSENARLKAEILRLHEQQLDVDLEVWADEAGLDKETQEEIIKMADETCRKAREEEKRVWDLEEENEKLKDALSELTVAARTISEDHAYMVYDAVDEDFKLEREVLRSQIEKAQIALQPTKNKEA